MGNYLFYRNLISLKNASKAKKQYSLIYYNKLTFDVITLLYEKGYIFGYFFLSKNKLKVFLKYYNGIGFFDNLKFFSSIPKNISFRYLIKLFSNYYYFNYKICFTCSFGIFFLDDFLFSNLNCGGFILFIL